MEELCILIGYQIDHVMNNIGNSFMLFVYMLNRGYGETFRFEKPLIGFPKYIREYHDSIPT